MTRMFAAPVLALSFVLSANDAAAAEEVDIQEYVLQVVVGDLIVDHDYAALKSMATEQGRSSRGTKTASGVAIKDLIKKSQTRDREYRQVVILSDERTLIFEGDNLPLVDHLILKLGDSHAAIMADSPESYEKMRSVLGKPRFKLPRRIFVYETVE